MAANSVTSFDLGLSEEVLCKGHFLESNKLMTVRVNEAILAPNDIISLLSPTPSVSNFNLLRTQN